MPAITISISIERIHAIPFNPKLLLLRAMPALFINDDNDMFKSSSEVTVCQWEQIILFIVPTFKLRARSAFVSIQACMMKHNYPKVTDKYLLNTINLIQFMSISVHASI